jgi:hypothetical protein
MVETYTIPQCSFNYHDDYDDRSERNHSGQSLFAYYIKNIQLQFH